MGINGKLLRSFDVTSKMIPKWPRNDPQKIPEYPKMEKLKISRHHELVLMVSTMPFLVWAEGLGNAISWYEDLKNAIFLYDGVS